MQKLPRILMLFFIMLPLNAAENKAVEKKYTQESKFEKLKTAYVECVLSKGVLYSKVSSVTESVQFAPIACKRKLLQIKHVYLNSAFKKEVIAELIESIREGVEIDLVKEIYKEKLINYRDQ